MGRLLPLYLTRAATILVSGLLLFAALGGRAHAQDDNYGLKRFAGDNYDSAPVRLSPPSAPTGFKQVPVAPVPRLSAARPAAAPYYQQPGYQGSGAGYEYKLGPADKL